MRDARTRREKDVTCLYMVSSILRVKHGVGGGLLQAKDEEVQYGVTVLSCY